MINNDNLTGATITIDLVHERIHAGRTFQSSYKTPNATPIADDSQVDILIKTTTLPVHFAFSVSAGGNLEILFYEDTVVDSDGSALAVVGMNRYRSIAPTVTTHLNPTIATIGNEIFNGFDSRGVGLSMPEARPDSEWVLKTNTNYLIRMINRAGAARDMSIVLQWYQALGG